MQPLVTIAIPVYNEERFLEEAIRSALHQTYTNLEIIIGDNASSDNTGMIIQQYCESDNRITAFRHKKNMGVHENFEFLKNKGQGKYFMWLGGHDIVHREFVAEAVSRMEENPGIALYYPLANYFANDVQEQLSSDMNPDLDTGSMHDYKDRMLKVIDNFGACSAFQGLFRKSVIDQYRFDKYGSDHLFLLQASFFGNLVPSAEIRYHRRKVREETHAQQVERLKTYGYKNEFPLYCTFAHFKNIFYWDKIPDVKTRVRLVERIYLKLSYLFARIRYRHLVIHLLLKEFHPRLFLLLFRIKTAALYKRLAGRKSQAYQASLKSS
jgi:glycosyltransferase involved in cell wall biosynthesis